MAKSISRFSDLTFPDLSAALWTQWPLRPPLLKRFLLDSKHQPLCWSLPQPPLLLVFILLCLLILQCCLGLGPGIYYFLLPLTALSGFIQSYGFKHHLNATDFIAPAQTPSLHATSRYQLLNWHLYLDV